MDSTNALDKPKAGAGLRIGIVGGGRRCLSLLKMMKHRALDPPGADIVGVADTDPSAMGLAHASELGLFTTTDPKGLYDLPGLDLLVNLTGDPGLSDRLAENAPDGVNVLSEPASRLYQEIARSALQAGRRLDYLDNEISRAQSFARAMDQATIVGVMILNTDFQIVWINNAGLRTAGLSRGEAIGRYCYQVSHQQVHPCTPPDTPCPMQETLRTGLAAQAMHEHIHPDGRSTYCDISTYPLFDREGRVVEVVEVVRDMTHDLNEKLERRTNALKKDLARLVQEDKLVSLGKLVASVAHEINNPIGSIVNFTKLIHKCLQNGETQPEELKKYERYLGMTVREAQRCGDIVGSLLSFARQHPIEPKVIDVREIIDRIVVLTTHRLELADIRLSIDLGDEPLRVWGDFTQVQQCILNLVFNAQEAMPEGGRLMIGARADRTAGLVHVEVSDTGIGIATAHINQIFEPFFTTKEDGHGVGLGLSMVYGIIREHGGEVNVRSQEGIGTTFRIDLPITARNGSKEAG